jgi:hypothetical protein
MRFRLHVSNGLFDLDDERTSLMTTRRSNGLVQRFCEDANLLSRKGLRWNYRFQKGDF